MRILCIATKPPWPPRDGGRLALAKTIDALADAGHHVCVIAPVAGTAQQPVREAEHSLRSPNIETIVCASEGRGWLPAAWAGWRDGSSASLARHRHPAVAISVAGRIASVPPDVVHVEQLQAFAGAEPAFAAGIPVVLRMQNVESSLLEQAVALRAMPAMTRAGGALVRLAVRGEANRIRRDEASAVVRAAVTVALSDYDAAELRKRCAVGPDAVIALPPPFPAELAPGPDALGQRSAGSVSVPAGGNDVAVAIAGSDWWPNADGVRWFVDEIAPRLAAARIATRVFGGRPIDTPDATPWLRWLPPPDDSAIAFPRDAIVAVPLRAASGIRMRILEAFARGCAVVATTVAARGLDVVDGRELSIADEPDVFASSIARLAADRSLRDAMIADARKYLLTRHGPSVGTLVDAYRCAIARGNGAR